MSTEKNKIHCTGCKKVIGELDYLNDGKFSIKCKCGVINTIEAAPKKTAETKVITNGHGMNLGIFTIQHITSEQPVEQPAG